MNASDNSETILFKEIFMSVRFTGTITTFFSARLFGFITADSDQVERFFHKSNFSGGDEPEVGIRVEFELGAPSKIGRPPQCVRVRPVGVPPTVRVAEVGQ